MWKTFFKVWGMLLAVMLGVIGFILSLIWMGTHVGLVGVLIEGAIGLSALIAFAITADLERKW